MKTETWNNSIPRPISTNNASVKQGGAALMYPVLGIAGLIKKLLLGLYRLAVSIFYHLTHFSAGNFPKVRLPWFKLGLAAFAVFLLMKKDMQFQINMRSPLGAFSSDERRPVAQSTALREQMNLAGGLDWGGKSAGKATGFSIDQLDEQEVRPYIQRFRKVAQSEMQKFGVPASIKMAQAIIESRAGTQTGKSHNHFGAPMAAGRYETAWENWRAHSLLLKEGPYRDQLPFGGSCKQWAKQLAKTGYSTLPGYDQLLLDIIRKYDLNDLD